MGADPMTLVGALVETANTDTVYRDLYLGRAQTLLSPVISVEDFHRIEQEKAVLTELPLAVARAGQRGLAASQRAEPTHGRAQARRGQRGQAVRDRSQRVRRG